MSLIAAIQRLASFTAFQQSQGDDSFPGTQIDADLDQTNNAVNALSSKVGAVIRSDGKLANGSVPRSALAADLVVGVGAARPWDSTALYLEDDTVTRGYSVWQAVIGNSGIDPNTDNGTRWALVADLSQAVTIAAGGVGPTALADDAVTRRAMAPAAVGTEEMADASVTRAKAAPGFGLMPVGATVDFYGLSAPSGWLFAAGQPVSRSTYAALFNALSLSITADVAAGSTSLTNASRSIASLGLRGAIVEGPGVPAGTTLSSDADGGLTLSAAATATSAGASIRLLPYGRGDGSTTFNLPDRRGRVSFGRDDMGGTAAGRLSVALDGANLSYSAAGGSAGNAAGRERATLTNANLPAALPAGKVTVNFPVPQYETRSALTTVSSGAGGTPVGNVWAGVVGKDSVVSPTAADFNISQPNPGGGTPFSVVPPAAVSNVIIFTGV